MSEHQQELMRLLHFTEGDVLANRHGHLSSAQLRYVSADRIVAVLVYLVIVAFLALFIAGNRTDPVVMETLVPVSAVIAVVGLVVVLLYWTQSGEAKKNGRVRKIDGPVSIASQKAFRGNRRVNYTIRIHGVAFRVTRTQGESFKPGQLYRIYYRMDNRRLLSVEFLGEKPVIDDGGSSISE